MKRFLAFYQKEMLFLIRQPLTFLFLLLAVLLNNWLSFNAILLNQVATLQPLWQNLPFFFLFLAPLTALVLINEERQNNRQEILKSLPLSEPFVLGAKITAAFSLLFIIILFSFPLAAGLFWLASPDKGVVLGGYFAASLLLLAYLLASFFFATLSRHNLAGFFLGFLFLLGDDLLSQEFLLLHFPKLGPWLTYLSLQTHYQHFTAGLLTLADALFFLTWLIFFWLATVIIQESRRQ